MNKSLLTYLFAFILITSIVVPAYLSILEISYECAIEKDLDEESETKKIEEVKILTTTFFKLNKGFSYSLNSIDFYAKDYNSISRKLELPPPELLS